uniref:Actinodin1 n=1 Tax=Oncorhynchus kisutch TaxID=8019 RepID=A0A8C7DQ36_ONCKI
HVRKRFCRLQLTLATSGSDSVCVSSEFLSAGPVVQMLKGDGDATEETVVAMASPRRLVRNRRNISWYKQHSDFWSWYKYFTDNGNTEAVQELDKVYLAYLQNKNRAEGRRSYKAYLGHLGDIYKACADSEDPNCVASATNRPKPEPKTPPKPVPAPVKACDPYRDPYCLYAALARAKSQPPPSPAPVKAPAPLYARSPVAIKDPHSGYYYYYSPAVQSFLSKEQKSELLRICSAEDVECLQFHLRAAFGHKPSAGPLPSYAHLGCDPKDPACKPQLVQKGPSGLFLRYPNCDPRDPRCAYAPRAPAPYAPAGPGSCNPLFEDGCNPLTATKFATAPEKFKEEHKDDPAAMPNANANTNDPFAMFREAATSMHRRTHPSPQGQAPVPPPRFEEAPQEDRHPLGPRGKTKEGYECYIGYDQECYPITRTEPRSGAHRNTAYPAEPYEPHLNADGSRNGVLEPSDPDCDPEYDTNCRLRRYQTQEELLPYSNAQAEHHGGPEAEPSQDHSYSQGEPERDSEAESEPYQSGQEETYGTYPPPSGMPSFQDMLRGYGDQYPEQDDHRAYAADYSKK